MTKTENYQLNQWDAADPVRREDFNADNAAVDAALKSQQTALSAHAAALGQRGNCKIVSGSYVGTGEYGSTARNSLTFLYPPLFIAVQVESPPRYSASSFFRVIRGSNWFYSCETNTDSSCTAAWDGNTLTWYSSSSASFQANVADTVYHYVALLQMDE